MECHRQQSVRDEDQSQEVKAEEGGSFEATHKALDDVHWWFFFWCRTVGLHVITRNHRGEYVMSFLGITMCVVMTAVTVVSLGTVLEKLFTPLPFWFSVVLCSVACRSAYSVYAFLQTCYNVGRMKKYMAAFGEVPARRDDGWRKLRAVGNLCYCLLVSITCLLLLQGVIVFNIVFIITAVPTLLDKYIIYFSEAIKEKLQHLALEVRRRDSWKVVEVGGVSLQWMAVTQLLHEHNKVSTAYILSFSKSLVSLLSSSFPYITFSSSFLRCL